MSYMGGCLLSSSRLKKIYDFAIRYDQVQMTDPLASDSNANIWPMIANLVHLFDP